MPDPYVEREREADRIKRMYDDVEDAIIAWLVAAYATFDQERIAQATAEAKAMTASALEQTRVWTDEAVPFLYGEQVADSAATIAEIEAMSDRMFVSMTATVWRRFDDLAANFDQQYRRWLALERFTAKREGRPTPQIASDMEAHLRENGITAFTDAAGRKWKLSSYADMAARTTVMEAQNAGVKDRVIAAGKDLVAIVGPLDYPDGCPPSVLDGPYSLTGLTKQYEGREIITLSQVIDRYGVFHPRCRHVLVGV
jgi:hypothetical protein